MGRWCGIAEFGAGRDDGLERDAVGAVLEHQRTPVPGPPPSRCGPGGGHPRSISSASAESAAAHAARSNPTSKSSLTIRSSSTRPGTGSRSRVRREHRPGRELVHRHHVALERQRGRAPPTHRFDEVRGAGAGDLGPQIGNLFPDLREVAAVGADDGALLGPLGVGGVHEQRGVRSGEPGEIADVHQIRHQKCVEIPGGEGRAQRRAPRTMISRHVVKRTGKSPPGGRGSTAPVRWREQVSERAVWVRPHG